MFRWNGWKRYVYMSNGCGLGLQIDIETYAGGQRREEVCPKERQIGWVGCWYIHPTPTHHRHLAFRTLYELGSEDLTCKVVSIYLFLHWSILFGFAKNLDIIEHSGRPMKKWATRYLYGWGQTSRCVCKVSWETVEAKCDFEINHFLSKNSRKSVTVLISSSKQNRYSPVSFAVKPNPTWRFFWTSIQSLSTGQ